MSDYTPTMARIEDMYAWAYAWRTVDSLDDGETDLSGLRATQRAEFQRALAAHDRKIAAEALRDAAREMRGDGKRVLIDAEESADWLDNYADGFEQGGES